MQTQFFTRTERRDKMGLFVLAGWKRYNLLYGNLIAMELLA